MSESGPVPPPSTEPPIPIIDSHIHLYPASELHTLAWHTPSSPLTGQHSVDEYSVATSAASSLRGFVFLETDRINDLGSGARDGSGWAMPLQEVSWLSRIAAGRPLGGEGHTPAQKDLCLGIVPWAPLPSGVPVLERYVAAVRERMDERAWGLVRGFRFLLQDKERGTMLRNDFIEGLRWLGRSGFVFDLGVDQRSGGDWQLGEVAELVRRTHEGVAEKDQVTFIISKSCPFAHSLDSFTRFMHSIHSFVDSSLRSLIHSFCHPLNSFLHPYVHYSWLYLVP